jgi:hypothetical protein
MTHDFRLPPNNKQAILSPLAMPRSARSWRVGRRFGIKQPHEGIFHGEGTEVVAQWIVMAIAANEVSR